MKEIYLRKERVMDDIRFNTKFMRISLALFFITLVALSMNVWVVYNNHAAFFNAACAGGMLPILWENIIIFFRERHELKLNTLLLHHINGIEISELKIINELSHGNKKQESALQVVES